MSEAKMRAVVAADAVITQGDTEVADAEKLKATDPASAERLGKQGRDDIARGEAMKAQAAGMK